MGNFTVEFFNLVLLASLIILLFLLPRLWALRHVEGAIELLLCSLSCGVWAFGYILEILMPDLPLKLFWAKFQYWGIATVTVWVLLFLLRYTGHATWFNYQHMLALLIIPTLTIAFAATNEVHLWMWTSSALQPGWSIAPLALGHGWWFWVEIIYSYLLLLGGTALLTQFIFRTQRLYLSQSLVMLVAMLVPWLGNALYIFGIRPGPNLDLTPIAFTITNIGLIVGFVRFRLLDMLPVAYSSIFKFMSDGVVVLDAKDRLVDINPAARRIFHLHGLVIVPDLAETGVHDPFIGHTIGELLPGQVQPTHGLVTAQEKEIKLSQGAEKGDRIYTLTSTPILNRRQQTTGQVLIFTDITKLKSAEEQMRLQVTALEAAGNGIVITNPQGAIEWVNPAFTELTGYTPEEAQGQNPRILKSGQHHEAYYKSLWESILAGKVWRGEVINLRKNGSLYNEEMTITPMFQADGAIAHFIAIKQDVSVRKQAEQELKLAHEQAVESNRLKTQLLANVSHDMRTPLGAIIGYSDMLINGYFGEMKAEQVDALADIQDSANQLLLFINNMIGQTQFETGRILLKPKLFEAQELVDACEAGVRLPASRKKLQLVYEIDPGVPQMLFGDLYWLRQIVLNLVNNAVKFTDRGVIKFRVYVPDAKYWAIEVADTGIGISAEAQAAIFEPFRQVDGVEARARGGSGLGLAIVKELTTLMNGQIHLISQPGAGSIFTIFFPTTYPPS